MLDRAKSTFLKNYFQWQINLHLVLWRVFAVKRYRLEQRGSLMCFLLRSGLLQRSLLMRFTLVLRVFLQLHLPPWHYLVGYLEKCGNSFSPQLWSYSHPEAEKPPTLNLRWWCFRVGAALTIQTSLTSDYKKNPQYCCGVSSCSLANFGHSDIVLEDNNVLPGFLTWSPCSMIWEREILTSYNHFFKLLTLDFFSTSLKFCFGVLSDDLTSLRSLCNPFQLYANQ